MSPSIEELMRALPEVEPEAEPLSLPAIIPVLRADPPPLSGSSAAV